MEMTPSSVLLPLSVLIVGLMGAMLMKVVEWLDDRRVG